MESLTAQYAAVDAVVRPAVFRAIEPLGLAGASPHTLGLPLVASPTPLVLSLAAYLLIVAAGLLVPRRPRKAEKEQDPLWLRGLVMLHNVVLTTLSLYMCLRSLYEAFVVGGYRVWGQGAPGKDEVGMAHVIWLFYVSKLYEFMDTFIMLLKGNLRQVSFLHVYHHGTISFVWWMITYYAPGGDAYFSCALNSWVHVLMYTYYLIASLLPKDPKVRRRWLWWGKYLTMFQMAQFAANLGQGVYTYRYSSYPRGISALLVVYMVTLLGLFGQFFLQKHGKAAGADSKAKEKGA